MKLDQYATMRGYQLANTHQGSSFIDHILSDQEQGDQVREQLKLRRIQFDTVPQLADGLEQVCSLLHCSKREFLEMAVSEAIDRANAQFQDAFAEAAGLPIEDAFPG